MQTANAVGIAGLPDYDNCTLSKDLGKDIEDTISQNSVIKGDTVKTIHIEKELFDCHLVQGDIKVMVDVTTVVELYENITAQEVIDASAVVLTCIREETTGTTIDCESYTPGSSPVFVGSDCKNFKDAPRNPQEADTVKKGSIAKTIISQKEIFECKDIGDSTTDKKIDDIIFEEVYENLNTHEITSIQFHSMRCVVLVTDDDPDTNTPEDRDARVESCVFKTIEN